MTDEFADIRARLSKPLCECSANDPVEHYDETWDCIFRQEEGEYWRADATRLLAAIDERDKRIAELEANGVDHCDSCSCNYDPTVTR